MHRLSQWFLMGSMCCLVACAQYGEKQYFSQLNYGFGYYLGYGVRTTTVENRYVINYLGSLATAGA
jgi:hypothetical protein